jgi:hypothetical protein
MNRRSAKDGATRRNEMQIRPILTMTLLAAAPFLFGGNDYARGEARQTLNIRSPSPRACAR